MFSIKEEITFQREENDPLFERENAHCHFQACKDHISLSIIYKAKNLYWSTLVYHLDFEILRCMQITIPVLSPPSESDHEVK